MRILYDNVIDGITGTSLTALTSATNYSIINVQRQILAETWRSTAVTAQTVVIDLGMAESINTAAILNHNFTNSVTLTVEGNTSNSWPGAFSQILTYNSGIIMNFFSSQSYRYWRFSMSDPANTLGYLQVGRLWLGNYVTIDPSSLLDFKVTKKRNDTVVFSKGRQKYASIGVGWREFDLNFPPTQTTSLNIIQTMFDHSGNHSSLIFANFDTIRNYEIVEPCYCSIIGDITFAHDNYMKFTYGLKLGENK